MSPKASTSLKSRAYVPTQGDLVWIDFDPTRGREIKKCRPACVVSSNAYNKTTGFVVVCPISSRLRAHPANLTLKGTQTNGQIITAQLRSLDVSPASGRRLEFIEQLSATQFGMVAQMVNHIFDFDPLFNY
jgi:mRNA interferase MazF